MATQSQSKRHLPTDEGGQADRIGLAVARAAQADLDNGG